MRKRQHSPEQSAARHYGLDKEHVGVVGMIRQPPDEPAEVVESIHAGWIL